MSTVKTSTGSKISGWLQTSSKVRKSFNEACDPVNDDKNYNHGKPVLTYQNWCTIPAGNNNTTITKFGFPRKQYCNKEPRIDAQQRTNNGGSNIQCQSGKPGQDAKTHGCVQVNPNAFGQQSESIQKEVATACYEAMKLSLSDGLIRIVEYS